MNETLIGEAADRLDSPPRLISVVIPAHGVEEYLSACLDSVLLMPSLLEAIVVDDASPDLSGEIARQYSERDERIRVITKVRNAGVGAARNTGLAAAKGEFIIFIDSDDLVEPAGVEAMLKSLLESGADFATAPADEFAKGQPRKRYWTLVHPIFRLGARLTNLHRNPELIWDHTPWTKLYRRQFMLDHDLRWPENTKCEDVLQATRAYTSAGGIDVVPHIACLYRRRSGSATGELADEVVMGDWGRQTLAALETVQAYGDPGVVREFVRKTLTVEVGTRLERLNSMRVERELEDASKAVDAFAPIADPGVMSLLPRHLREALQERWGRQSTAGTPADNIGSSLDTTLRGVPLLTIVMPTHNVEQYIDDAIKSILSQTFENFELIVVDDSSVDRTFERLTTWEARDSRLRLYRNPGSGGGQARNFGVEMARGDLLTFADGDDLLPRRAYAEMVQAMVDSRADLAVGDYQKFWATKTWRAAGRFGLDQRLDSTTLMENPRLISNRTCWNRMFRTAFWRDLNLHFPTTPRANDIFPITIAMAAAKAIVVVPKVVYHYRARSGSGSMTSRLARPESISGYLNQEMLCASAVGRGSISGLRREYWSTALAADTWDHLGKFLEAVTLNEADESTNNQVVTAFEELWRLAPLQERATLPWRQQITYALTVHGDLASAQQMYRLHNLKPESRDRETAWTALSALEALPPSNELTDAVLRVFREDVLRPLIDDGSEWVSPPAAAFRAATERIAQRWPLHESPVPETREPRLLNALLSGNDSTLVRESFNDYDRTPLALTLHESVRGVHVVIDPEEEREVTRLEWVEHSRTGAGRRLPLPREKDGSVLASWTSLDSLAGSKWSLQGVIHDGLGMRSVQGKVRTELRPARSSRLRWDGTNLLVLRTGAERLARAVTWRRERLSRRLRAAAASWAARPEGERK